MIKTNEQKKEVEKVLLDRLPSGSKEYRKLSISLDSGYKWGSGMPLEDAQRFYLEMDALFVSAGWEYHEPISSSYSPEYSKGKSRLYCHPMEITGPCEASLIPEVCQLMAKVTTSTVIEMEDQGRVFDATDEQYFAMLHALRPQIEQDLLQAFSQLEMGSDTKRLESVMMNYRVWTLKNHTNMVSSMHPYWKYTEDVFKNCLSEGKIVKRPDATEFSSLKYVTAIKYQPKDQSYLDSQIQSASKRASTVSQSDSSPVKESSRDKR